ncbi:MAG: hypothetical protein ACRYFU_16310 [Janthinobacterium lividum]
MSKYFSISSAFRRSLALGVVAGSSLAIAGAQAVPAVANTTTVASPTDLFTVRAANLQTPFSGASDEDASSSSSSSSLSDVPDPADAASHAASNNLATLEKGINLPGVNPQYGRRRYGAPRYRGSNTNADGSEKYTVFAGAGFTLPIGSNSNYLTTSYGFQVGAGRNFNKHVGLNVEFDWDKFGFTGQTIGNQNLLYNELAGIDGVDGNSHIWSFTLDPIYYLKSGEGLGVYVTGGGGFYHKTANFFVPTVEEGYDAYGYLEEYEANETVDKYSSNSVGVNGGVGFTYKFSKFANERFFGEIRYVHTFNSYRPGAEIDLTNQTISSYNLFPQNSQTTSYLPVKFGIRF